MAKRTRSDEWSSYDEELLCSMQAHSKQLSEDVRKAHKAYTRKKQKQENHSAKIRELTERKKRTKFAPAVRSAGKTTLYDLVTLGEMIKNGELTREEFRSYFDPSDLRWRNGTVFDFILDQDYEDSMFCVFYDFEKQALTHHDLDEYRKLMKDPAKINLYAK